MTDHMIVEPFMHHQDLRTTGDVRMDCHGEDRVVHFPVHPIELIAPRFFEMSRTDEPVAVRRLFL